MAYENGTDLPKLWGLAANVLNLAPDNHSLEPIKVILRSAITLVNGLGTLRNRLGDAHGHGSKPVKPTSRHADLAVNIAGAVASFLVETHQLRRNK